MSRVTAQMSVSLDGHYAGPRFAGPGSWMDSEEAAGFFRVTRWVTDAMAWRERQGFTGGDEDVNSEIVGEMFASAGAYVMGRRMFDGGELPWGEVPPFRAPVFVATSTPREPLVRGGGTTFTFVTDGLASAVEQAREAAADKDVAVAGGGTFLRAVIAAGLLDELELHVAPVLLGRGMRLLDGGLGLDPLEGVELEQLRVLHTPEVLHVRYRVSGRAPLLLDDRGSGGGRTTVAGATG